MRLFGYDLRVTRATPPGVRAPARGSGGWFSLVRDPYPGAWQKNDELVTGGGIQNPTVFTCVSLIASDIAKLALRLVTEADGIFTPTTNSAYSPVLRRPNRYQLAPQFTRQWLTSKLIAGNAYALKQRDGRGVVSAAYVLNPRKVQVLIAPDGAVYYELSLDELAGVPAPLEGTGRDGVVVPASEIMHDVGLPLEHPLVGVSPLYAAASAALQGSTISGNSTRFFSNGAYPGGVILIPTDISKENAKDIEDAWKVNFSGENAGNVAILSRGAKFEPLAMSAVDAQLIDQLKWSAETICSVYHVPYYLAGGPPPPYANADPLVQQYYSQCLQSLITDFETVYADGLELASGYALECDVDDLMWLDFEARAKAAHDTINAGALSPNEARRKFFGLGPVAGGASPYLQQQYYPLSVLADRELVPPSAVPTLADDTKAAALELEAARLAGRLERLEAAAPVCGPPGAEGAPGPPGADGAPGADGLGLEDFACTFDGERTLELRLERGGLVKRYALELPIPIYRDVWDSALEYERGDIVTHGGSSWSCLETTRERPGDGSKAWRLMVKRGRDGRDVGRS